MSETCIIVGASHAAAQLVASLRQSGWEGPIILFGDEAELPYHRPPLSKEYMSGDKGLDDILIRPADSYAAAGIDMRLGVRVTQIDREAKTVTTDKGESLAYDKLVLCTGARVRRLPIPGADSDGVFYLRDAADARAVQAAITPKGKAVIIGGGYIGLEAAASLTKQGMSVTVLEAMDRILQRVTSPVMSDFYRRVHTEEGVTIAEGQMASAIETTDGKRVVVTRSGDRFEADIVMIGIGVIPNTELADEEGLTCDNGIVVNEYCQTSDPDIYAAGDVANHFNVHAQAHIRVESVPNATEQAKVVAGHMTGKPKPYDALPWFWSDQFDLKLQIAGLSAGADDVIVRSDADNPRALAAFSFKGDRLLSVDAVNAPRAFMATRMALSKGKTFAKDGLDDPGVNLKELMRDRD